MKQELWKEVDGERQFLIPIGQPLEAGTLAIENSNGIQLLVSENAIYSYLASPEQVEAHQDQKIEDTVTELGNAFGNLFAAGKSIFQQALHDMENASVSEDSAEETPEDNIVDLDAEEEKEAKNDFFSEMRTLFGSAKGEFRGILEEAKEELKESLQDPEMIDIIRSLGNQIVDLADTLEKSEESSYEEISEAHSEEDPAVEENSDPNPKADASPSTEEAPPNTPLEDQQIVEENSDDIPPSPISDDD